MNHPGSPPAVSAPGVAPHYDARYYAWQREVGQFTARANRRKFAAFAREDLRLLDFGCGGGFMLAALPARERRGIEINPAAREEAARNGLEVVSSTDEVPDDWADLLISDNALEHTHHPLEVLRRLLCKLQPGGTAVFVLPCEHLEMAYDAADVNQHLYSWSPLAAGNLFKLAGFEVVSSRAFYHKHFPYAHHVFPIVGQRVFDGLCALYGYFNRRNWNELRVIARRP